MVAIIKRQERADKLLEKLRKKKENKDIYDAEYNNKLTDYDSD